MHKKRADVLRHFKKDAANLAIAWSQYQSEQHHRYSNAALRMQNGLKIQPDEQQQLLTHARAITEALPEEMNPIAVGQNERVACTNTVQAALPSKVVAFPGREQVAEDSDSANWDGSDQELQAFFSSSTILANNQAQPITHDCSFTTRVASIPTDSDGFAENPDAYKVWSPQPVKGEILQPSQFRKKLAALTRKLSMPKQGTRD